MRWSLLAAAERRRMRQHKQVDGQGTACRCVVSHGAGEESYIIGSHMPAV